MKYFEKYKNYNPKLYYFASKKRNNTALKFTTNINIRNLYNYKINNNINAILTKDFYNLFYINNFDRYNTFKEIKRKSNIKSYKEE